MPAYTFTLHNHIHDSIDVDLADDDAAQIEAIRFGGELLRDQPDLLRAGESFEIIVANAGGAELFRIDMRAIRPGG